MVTEFEQKVYNQISLIPRGKVSTYKLVAQALKTSPRAVGNALAKNPFAPKVPCHRVIKSDLTIGGFNGRKREIDKKIALLRNEGIEIVDQKVTISSLHSF